MLALVEGRRYQPEAEQSSTSRRLLPRLPLEHPRNPAAHPHPPSGTTIGGFTIVYRSAQVMRVGAYCVIGPGAVVKDGASIGHRCYIGSEAVIGRGAAGCVVAPGCGTVAELGSGVMVLDQPL